MRCLLFTFNKAGSMGHHRFLGWLAEVTGLAHHSMNYSADDPAGRRFRLTSGPTQGDRSWWHDTGRHLDGIIGPIRRPAAIPEDVDARVVIAVRDPRDALTSLFYSRAMSHGGVDPDRRQAWLEMGIDRLALERLPDFSERLARYREQLEARPDWRLLRYEDMVLRFDQWLDGLLQGFGLEPDQDAVGTFARLQVAEYASLIADRQACERTDHHIRSIAPGDYRKKLRPDTIAAIDAAMAHELAFFGYARSVLSSVDIR